MQNVVATTYVHKKVLKAFTTSLSARVHNISSMQPPRGRQGHGSSHARQHLFGATHFLAMANV